MAANRLVQPTATIKKTNQIRVFYLSPVFVTLAGNLGVVSATFTTAANFVGEIVGCAQIARLGFVIRWVICPCVLTIETLEKLFGNSRDFLHRFL